MSESTKATIPARPGSKTRSAGAVDFKSMQAEVEALERLDLGTLRIQWRNRWGRLAPASLPRGMLYRVLAYRIQTEAFGDLDRETVRLLGRFAASPLGANDFARPGNVEPDKFGLGNAGPPVGATIDEPKNRKPARPPSREDVRSPMVLKPGALLTREWQGRIERVMALEKGFAWNGQTFGSLSGVAFAITGVKWSGQRFFFGSAGRKGPEPAANRPDIPPDPKPTTARRPGTSMGQGRNSAATSSLSPPPSAASSADRLNWRRRGKAQERSLSRERAL
jgi:Protein of unknown function (DUF2924)